eukprot:2841619-Rhodomonas_salina.2
MSESQLPSPSSGHRHNAQCRCGAARTEQTRATGKASPTLESACHVTLQIKVVQDNPPSIVDQQRPAVLIHRKCHALAILQIKDRDSVSYWAQQRAPVRRKLQVPSPIDRPAEIGELVSKLHGIL